MLIIPIDRFNRPPQPSRKLEARRYKRGECTIVSLDVMAMYPSMRFSLLEKSVEYFTHVMPRVEKEKAQACLEMLKFGMQNTFLTFGDKYYRYRGGGTADDPGLTIGGFKSAWLADLGYLYILEKLLTIVNATDLMEVYRDDNITVFDGAVDKEFIHSWVSRLQAKADRLTGSAPVKHIGKFTVVMWGTDDGFDSDIVEVLDEPTFPFLDMEMFWSAVCCT